MSDGAERGRQMTFAAYTDQILSRAGVPARRERSPILTIARRRTSLETCSCGKLVGSTVRPSAGAVLSRLDENTHHGMDGESFCQAA